MNYFCHHRDQWVGPMFVYDESWREDIPFLADHTTSDILILCQWNFYIPMNALNWYKSHRRDALLMQRIDPDDFDPENDDSTYYEKLADIEKCVSILLNVREELNSFITKEGATAPWFMLKMMSEVRNQFVKTKFLKEGWERRREQVIIHHQKLRFMEFASLLNRKFYQYGVKENYITRNILLFMFDLHPRLRPRDTVKINLYCSEDEESLIN